MYGGSLAAVKFRMLSGDCGFSRKERAVEASCPVRLFFN